MRIASQGWFTGTVTAISSDGTHLTADTAPTGGNGKDATATTAGIVLAVTPLAASAGVLLTPGAPSGSTG